MGRKKPQAEVFFLHFILAIKNYLWEYVVKITATQTKHTEARHMSNETRELLEWLLKNTYDETIKEEIKKELKEG